MIERLGKVDAPLTALAAARAGSTVHCWFDHKAAYLPGEPIQKVGGLMTPIDGEIIALLASKETLDDVLHDVLNDVRKDVTPAGYLDVGKMQALATACRTNLLFLDRPLLLSTVNIPKPWGEEIWYTGIEARGVCRIGDTPLPWYLELVGNEFGGGDIRTPLLLKILAPRPEDGYGELYFEMHEQKVEVYVVTHVDESAWPDGTGGIRYGFNQAMIDTHDNLDSFRDAYLQTAGQYRAARVALDTELDRIRMQQGVDPNAVVATATLESWKQGIDADIVNAEIEARARLNTYSSVHPIRRGDVIRVPPFTPHSLQHGVRVVEFQTPHYERYILSFSQKVLTQDHWDTEVAIEQVNFSASFDTSLVVAESTSGCTVETVADFYEFSVVRITLSPGADYSIDLSSYAIVMCIDGAPSVNGTTIGAEQALLIPRVQSCLRLHGETTESRVLVAQPAKR